MKVKVTWEFEADVEDFDPKFVDIEGLAKDLTKTEVENLLKNKELTAEDFFYEVENEKENQTVSFEIEHYNGNTYLAFMAKIQDNGDVDVVKTLNCSHADTDNDYIFDIDNALIRIQADKPIDINTYNEILSCYQDNEKIES